jgi:dTDP-4-amino-4,6-dideoxygalactose transaminase
MKVDYTTVTEVLGIKAPQEQLHKLYYRGLAYLGNIQLLPSTYADNRFYDVYQNYVARSKVRDKPSLEHFSLPMTERVSYEVLSLPMYPELSDEKAKFVIKTIRNFYNNRG